MYDRLLEDARSFYATGGAEPTVKWWHIERDGKLFVCPMVAAFMLRHGRRPKPAELVGRWVCEHYGLTREQGQKFLELYDSGALAV